MPEITVSGEVAGKRLTFSTGKLAGQADGAVVAILGGSQMLVTATAAKKMREGIDFFPLTVDFEERMYAAGRIPGSFFRREGRPSEQAILTCRLIDRPLRPTFPDDYRCETHIVVTSLSVDGENPFDVVALNGASAALAVSPIPFQGPVGGVRVALRRGEWIAFPTEAELDESVFEMVVAGSRNASGGIDITMVEAGATPDGIRLIAAGDPASDEAAVAAGLEEAKGHIAAVIEIIEELAAKVDKPAVEWPTAIDYSAEMRERVESSARPRLAQVIRIGDKAARRDAEASALEATLDDLALSEDDLEGREQAARAFKDVLKQMMRDRVVDEGVRLDGRGPRDIRPLSAEVGVIERAHGSGLFQRGETQVLTIATLGMLKMEQMLDTLAPEESKRYMHHYNFPPFSTGEVGFMRGPKRREIGHGALAERALLPVIPTADDFPYALRVVSEVLSSNGSTSMASVCGSTLSLMDAGVPIAAPVAGIAMGLIHRDGDFVTLTDILGAEDALGDMDFKVAGTADVITALQLDTKISGLPSEVLVSALDQAREARLQVLEVMLAAIPEPRAEMNRYAPRIESIEIPKDKIGEVIGPKGSVVRELEAETGATIEIEEVEGKGIVRIASNDGDVLKATRERIMLIAFPPEPEIGEEYEGVVVNITKFGAFVNILPGTDGLLHISKLDGSKRVERVEDYLALGDKVRVRVGGIDRGKLSLDLVEALPGATLPEPRAEGEGRSGDDRGRRDRERGRRDRGDRDRGGRDRDRPRPQANGGDEAADRRRVARSFEETFE